jgi:hypothetical protein
MMALGQSFFIQPLCNHDVLNVYTFKYASTPATNLVSHELGAVGTQSLVIVLGVM